MRIKFIAMISMITIVIFTCPFFAQTVGNTHGNLVNNLGRYVKDSEYIYYSTENKDGYLYRIDLAATKKEQLNSDNCSYLNISDDYIYYRNESDGGTIYRIKKNGQEKEKLNNDNSFYVNLYEDALYYTNTGKGGNSAIFKINLDGSKRIKLNGDISRFINIYDGWIYYSNLFDNGSIYRIKTDGSERTKINNDDSWSLNIYNDIIYYTNSDDKNAIYKINIDGKNKNKLSPTPASYLNVHDGFIYYQDNSTKKNDIYRIDINGKNKLLVIEESGSFLNIINDYIYYKANDKDIWRKSSLDGKQNIKANLLREEEENILRKLSYNWSNIISGNGLLAVDAEYIFYSHQGHNGYLYRVKKDGSDMTLITDDNCSLLNLDNEYIYYKNENDNGYLYKIKKDGTEKECIAKDDAENIILSDEYLYYSANGLYKIKKDGTDKELLVTERVSDINLIGNELYYLTSRNICKLDLETKKTEKLDINLKIRSGLKDSINIVIGNSIYGCFFNNIYKISAATKESTLIVENDASNINIYNDYIYYTSSNGIFKIDINGKNKAKLDTDEAIELCIIDDIIYFRNKSKHGYWYKMSIDGTHKEKVHFMSQLFEIPDENNKYYGNTSGNIVNGGLSAESDYYIFYSDNDNLYRKQKDTGDITILCEGNISNINVHNDKGWVIFIKHSADMSELYKIKFDGKEQELLYKNTNTYYYNSYNGVQNTVTESHYLNINFVNLVDDYIFFEQTMSNADKNAVYRMDLDGKNRTKIIDEPFFVGNIIAYNGWIYYKLTKELVKVKFDGTHRTHIKNLNTYTNFQIYGEHIYYFSSIHNYGIQKTDLNGGNEEKIASYNAASMNIYDGWIYLTGLVDFLDIEYEEEYDEEIYDNYYEGEFGGKKNVFSGIKRISIDGKTEEQMLINGAFIQINIANRDLYTTLFGSVHSYILNLDDKTLLYTDGTPAEKIHLDLHQETDILGNTSGNIANSGLYAISDDGWIYFNYAKHLYKMKTDNSNITLLSDDNAQYINVGNDWVYYINVSDNYYIYKIKTDGTGKTRLNKQNSHNLILYNGHIYFSSENVHVMSTNGKGLSNIGRYGRYGLAFNIMNGWIYYRSYYGYYKMRLDGSEHKMFFPGYDYGERSIFITEYGLLYALSDAELCRLNAQSSTDKSVITTGYVTVLNVNDYWIYYANRGDKSKLYKTYADGTSARKLSDTEGVNSIYILGEWIYFIDKKGVHYKINVDGSGETVFEVPNTKLNETKDTSDSSYD